MSHLVLLDGSLGSLVLVDLVSSYLDPLDHLDTVALVHLELGFLLDQLE